MIRWKVAAVGLLAASTPTASALAQNAVAVGPADASNIEVSITPYTWLAGISGTTGAGGATGDLNLKFGDILQQLHFAAMAAGRVDYGRWHVTTDFMYSSVGQDTGPTGMTGGGISVHTQSVIGTVAAGYRIFDEPSWNLEAFVGLRGWDEMNLAIISGPRIGSRNVNFDRGWVDPIFGLQAAYSDTQACPRRSIRYRRVFGWVEIHGSGNCGLALDV